MMDLGSSITLLRNNSYAVEKNMPISYNHDDLFRQSDTAGKIALFQSLLEARDLHADEALALLKSIHADLEQPQGHDHTVYASYARMMEALHHDMPEVHQHVVENWHTSHSADTQREAAEEEAVESNSGAEGREAKQEEKSEAVEEVEIEEGGE